MREVRLRLVSLHAGQRALDELLTRHRYVTAVPGRRWGKTLFGTDRGIREALDVGRDYRMLWAAPTYDLTRIAWDEWRRLLPAELATFNKSERLIEMVNGARIFFRSTDREDALLGRGYSRAIIDEAARVSRLAIQQYILPSLADRNGSALAITTPLGKRNWAFEWFSRGAAGDHPEWASYQGASTENPNPAIQAWIRQMAPTDLGGEGGMPAEIYRQEVLAEFLEDAAAVFRRVRERIIDAPLLSWSAAREAGLKVIGIDVAKHADYTVMVGLDDGAPRRVLAFDRFHRIDWTLQKARIFAAWEEAGRPLVVLDSTGVGDNLFDELRALGMRVYPYKFTNESKQRVVQALATDIESGHLVYPNIPALIAELESFAYELTANGIFRYSAPEGAHDDTVIALALAGYGIKVARGLEQQVEKVRIR